MAGQNLPPVARKGGEGKDKEKTAGAAHPTRAVLTRQPQVKQLKTSLKQKKSVKNEKIRKIKH
jgi:hypothetical protein